MAHTCPTCGCTCHCNGDIDDINFGEEPFCDHCDDGEEDEWEDLPEFNEPMDLNFED